jgi:hypothetical protein
MTIAVIALSVLCLVLAGACLFMFRAGEDLYLAGFKKGCHATMQELVSQLRATPVRTGKQQVKN